MERDEIMGNPETKETVNKRIRKHRNETAK